MKPVQNELPVEPTTEAVSQAELLAFLQSAATVMDKEGRRKAIVEKLQNSAAVEEGELFAEVQLAPAKAWDRTAIEAKFGRDLTDQIEDALPITNRRYLVVVDDENNVQYGKPVAGPVRHPASRDRRGKPKKRPK